ncbi:C25 family cysteine peptidase [bacterium]|nr:C25 family cysteine peptidase [bacterium]MCI0606055.1 C25 family cysteine peptidase [bacterium]
MKNGAQVAPFYMENLIVDKNKRYEISSPSGDPWIETDILAFKTPVSKSFTLTVDNLVSANATTTLNVGLFGITDWPDEINPAPDHHVKVALNNIEVADLSADGVVNMTVNAALNAGALINGNNTVKVTVVGDTPFDYDMVAQDRYGVTYPRAFVARNGSLIFEGTGAAFRVDGLTSSSPVVYRVEGSKITQMTALKIAGSTGNFNVTFRGLTTAAKYVVVSAVALPPATPVKPLVNIKTGSAQLLVVSHPNFISGIQPLVDARKAQGYTVKVVDVNDIYAQFSHSNFDPLAIRDYIRFAAANLGTQYVLLVGGDTYDYHNYLGLGSISFIPTLYTRTHELANYSASDPLFTDFERRLLARSRSRSFAGQNNGRFIFCGPEDAAISKCGALAHGRSGSRSR